MQWNNLAEQSVKHLVNFPKIAISDTDIQSLGLVQTLHSPTDKPGVNINNTYFDVSVVIWLQYAFTNYIAKTATGKVKRSVMRTSEWGSTAEQAVGMIAAKTL